MMNSQHTVEVSDSDNAYWHVRPTDNRNSLRFVVELIEYPIEIQIYMSEVHLRALAGAVARCLERFGQLQSANAKNPQTQGTPEKSADLKETTSG